MSLPKVFANTIANRNDNNERIFHNEKVINQKKDPKTLKGYFDSNGYANKLIVNITTRDGIRKEKLILFKNDYVINIYNQRIYLDEILDYDVIK